MPCTSSWLGGRHGQTAQNFPNACASGREEGYQAGEQLHYLAQSVAAVLSAGLAVWVSVRVGTVMESRVADSLACAVPAITVSIGAVMEGRVAEGLAGLIPRRTCTCIRPIQVGRTANSLDGV